MSSAAAQVLDHEISTVIEVVVKRTVSFMKSEMAFPNPVINRSVGRAGNVKLRDITAIVGVGSTSGLYIAYSYDDALIREIMRRYTSELSIEPEEEDLYVQESASDIVNVIVGNCTADLARRGETVRLSPPVLMAGARTIHARPETVVFGINLDFPHGMLDLAFVGPKILFDENLNYTGEHA